MVYRMEQTTRTKFFGISLERTLRASRQTVRIGQSVAAAADDDEIFPLVGSVLGYGTRLPFGSLDSDSVGDLFLYDSGGVVAYRDCASRSVGSRCCSDLSAMAEESLLPFAQAPWKKWAMNSCGLNQLPREIGIRLKLPRSKTASVIVAVWADDEKSRLNQGISPVTALPLV